MLWPLYHPPTYSILSGGISIDASPHDVHEKVMARTRREEEMK